MSILQSLVITLKNTTTGISIYSGEIPEDADKPAVVINNIAYGNDRNIEGEKTKRFSQWRLTVVDTVQNLQNTIDQIELNDNTKNEFFQRLYVELNNIEPKALSEPYQRAFLDVTVYPK